MLPLDNSAIRSMSNLHSSRKLRTPSSVHWDSKVVLYLLASEVCLIVYKCMMMAVPHIRKSGDWRLLVDSNVACETNTRSTNSMAVWTDVGMNGNDLIRSPFIHAQVNALIAIFNMAKFENARNCNLFSGLSSTHQGNQGKWFGFYQTGQLKDFGNNGAKIKETQVIYLTQDEISFLNMLVTHVFDLKLKAEQI